jgi:hypothetical protein
MLNIILRLLPEASALAQVIHHPEARLCMTGSTHKPLGLAHTWLG